ncbi:MAG TPA: tetratricopeptide repeat protein [Thermoanaerobaculia bacterium]|nr:tetratricopeptide repeat protein [Thermoanaerobaculia bacterium]
MSDAAAEPGPPRGAAAAAAPATAPREGALRYRPSALLLASTAVLATVLAFLPALTCGFVAYDDPRGVQRYGMVLRGLSAQGVRWAFAQTDYFANWLPLTLLSHMLDWQLYGANAAGHHLSSVLLHAGTVALVFLLFQRTTGCHGRAAVAAALWGVHPLRVEPVVWIAARKDMTSGFFALLALLLYVGWVERRGAARYLAVTAAYALALLSKSMVMTLPAVMLLLDVWPLRRLPALTGEEGAQPGGRAALARQAARRVGEKALWLAMAAAAGGFAFFTQRHSGAMPDLEVVRPAVRLGNAALAVPRYLAATFWPAGLAAFYPLPAAPPAPAAVALSLLLIVAVSVVAVRARRRMPWLLCGWLWFLVVLLPVSGVVQVGDQSHADRYTYLPAIGLTVALVWTAGDLLQRAAAGRRVAALIGVVAVVACVACTRQQVSYWQSSRTLFGRMLAVDPDNHVGHLNLGPVLEDEGRLDEAIAHYRRAIALRPDLGRAYVNLGSALRRKGDRNGALEALQRAVDVDPELLGAQFDLAVVYDDLGRYGLAAGHLAKAIAIDPSYGPAWQGMAAILSRPGAPRQVLPFVNAVARAEPQAVELQRLVKAIAQRTGNARGGASGSGPSGPAPRAPGSR